MINLQGKVVYSSKYFDVREELSDSNKISYSTVYRKPIVIIFPITDDGEIYLISQYRRLFNEKILEAVAGHQDEGENALEGAKRELSEETGISAAKWENIFEFYSSGSVVKSAHQIFVARELELGVASPENDEDIKIVKLSIDEAMEKVLSGEIKTASTIIGLFLIERLFKENKL